MSLMIKDAAKQLQIGSKTLYDILHKKGLLQERTNYPRDSAVKAGYFKTEQRSCTIKAPGETTGRTKPYYVTLVTDAGMEFLRPIVTEYKARSTPAPRRVRVTLELGDANVVHALVRFAQLFEKRRKTGPDAMTAAEDDEYHRARKMLTDDLPVLASLHLERLNKKLFSHPKFQTVFQSQDNPQQTH